MNGCLTARPGSADVFADVLGRTAGKSRIHGVAVIGVLGALCGRRRARAQDEEDRVSKRGT